MELLPVRLDSEEELRLVMSWRNDPASRKASLHTEPKTWPAYREEFGRNYAGAPLLPRFVTDGSVRCGLLGFRRYAEWPRQIAVQADILIAPECRGKGLALQALNRIPELAREEAVAAVIAEVKEDNASSVRVFEQSPLRLRDQILKTVPEEGKSYRLLRYVWEMP